MNSQNNVVLSALMDYRVALYRQHEEAQKSEARVNQLENEIRRKELEHRKVCEENTRLKRRVEFSETLIRNMVENLAPFKTKQDQMMGTMTTMLNQVSSIHGNQGTILEKLTVVVDKTTQATTTTTTTEGPAVAKKEEESEERHRILKRALSNPPVVTLERIALSKMQKMSD